MKKNVIVMFRLYYQKFNQKLKMYRSFPLSRRDTKAIYTQPLYHYPGEEIKMEGEKQKHACSISILSLTHPHAMTSPMYVPMVTHDCFGENCPCQHLMPNNYCLCEFQDTYACMKRIGDEWFFFATNRPVFVTNWRETKWYSTYEEAMAFIYRYTAGFAQNPGLNSTPLPENNSRFWVEADFW